MLRYKFKSFLFPQKLIVLKKLILETHVSVKKPTFLIMNIVEWTWGIFIIYMFNVIK